jgi:hypothetical protein
MRGLNLPHAFRSSRLRNLVNLPTASGQSEPGSNTSSRSQLLMARAEAGEATAQDLMRHIYAEGLGVAIDYSEAVKWWTRAAEQGIRGSGRSSIIGDREVSQVPRILISLDLDLLRFLVHRQFACR